MSDAARRDQALYLGARDGQMDDAYWLREFAGRAMEGGVAHGDVPTVGSMHVAVKWYVDMAEALLTEIKRREGDVRALLAADQTQEGGDA